MAFYQKRKKDVHFIESVRVPCRFDRYLVLQTAVDTMTHSLHC